MEIPQLVLSPFDLGYINPITIIILLIYLVVYLFENLECLGG